MVCLVLSCNVYRADSHSNGSDKTKHIEIVFVRAHKNEFNTYTNVNKLQPVDYFHLFRYGMAWQLSNGNSHSKSSEDWIEIIENSFFVFC